MSMEVRMLNVINEQECLFSQSVFTRPSVSPGDQRRADKPLRGRSEGLWGSRVGTGRLAWNKSQKGKLMAIKTHARTHTHKEMTASVRKAVIRELSACIFLVIKIENECAPWHLLS